MSFGYSFGDIIGVTQLALQVAHNCRKACGEHDLLTRDVVSLHSVLSRLEQEVKAPESLLNRQGDSRIEDLETLLEGCGKLLSILDNILEKYNVLGEDKRAGKRLWSKIRFGNGEMQDLSELRIKISTYTSAITLNLNLISVGSQGRVEREISETLPKIRQSLNWIAAKLSANSDGSILSSYAGDEKGVWKEFRRELVSEGFASSHIREHKDIIIDYIKELGERGILDDQTTPEEGSATLHDELDLDLSSKKSIERRVFLREKVEVRLAAKGSEERSVYGPSLSMHNNTGSSLSILPRKSTVSNTQDIHCFQCGTELRIEPEKKLSSLADYINTPSVDSDSEIETSSNDVPEFFHPRHIALANELNCGHAWCSKCLRELFIKSIYTPSVMPPKCCDVEINPHYMQLLLLSDNYPYGGASVPSIKPLWDRKRREFTDERPAYCPNSFCGAWVEGFSRSILDKAPRFPNKQGRRMYALTCSECGRQLCASCHSNIHPYRACISNEKQEQNTIARQEANMRVNARPISRLIGVPEEEIIRGTLGRDIKHTRLISVAAIAYRILKTWKGDERPENDERWRYLG